MMEGTGYNHLQVDSRSSTVEEECALNVTWKDGALLLDRLGRSDHFEAIDP